ncbi:MAG: CDP-alcohol phosphatidyltransferase family protein [Actinomycetales bacterium]|nr:CDP-alcohol phosphatidyltransferase family protein [Actinomycetales bacterium]
MQYPEYELAWSKLHGDAKPTGLIKFWLRFVFALTGPLSRVSPNAVTVFGALLAAGLVWSAQFASLYLLVAVGIFLLGVIDGLDGALAVRRNQVSAWGSFIDSIVDRFVDVALLAILVVLGADPILAIIAGTVTLVHEYMRARAASVGFSDIGKVTIAEKPTRMILGFVAVVACAIAPATRQNFAQICAGVWLAIAVVGAIQLVLVYRKVLKQN